MDNVELLKSALYRYELDIKEPVRLEEAALLASNVYLVRVDKARWRRKFAVSVVPEAPAKRRLFSWVGSLCSNYLVGGWLRLVGS